jgi:hypothetical protein
MMLSGILYKHRDTISFKIYLHAYFYDANI